MKKIEKLVITDRKEIEAILKRRSNIKSKEKNLLPAQYAVNDLHGILDTYDEAQKKRDEAKLDEAYSVLHGFVEKMKFDNKKHDELVKQLKAQKYCFAHYENDPEQYHRLILQDDLFENPAIGHYPADVRDIRRKYYDDGLGKAIHEHYLDSQMSYMPNKKFKLSAAVQCPIVQGFVSDDDEYAREYHTDIRITVFDTRIVYLFIVEAQFKSSEGKIRMMPIQYDSFISDVVLPEMKLKTRAYDATIKCLKRMRKQSIETSKMYATIANAVGVDKIGGVVRYEADLD